MLDNAHWDAQSVADAANAACDEEGDGLLALHHPQHPFVGLVSIADIAAPTNGESVALQQLAVAYLAAVTPRLAPFAGGPVQLISTEGIFRSFENGLRLAWLPWGGRPDDSVLLLRTDPDTPTSILDVHVALFAAQVWEDAHAPSTAMRSGIGLRVDAVLHEHAPGQFAVRIVGAAFSGSLLQAIMAVDRPLAARVLNDFLVSHGKQFAELHGILAPVLAAAVGTSADQIEITGISTDADPDAAAGMLKVLARYAPAAGQAQTLHGLSASVALQPGPLPTPESPLAVVVSAAGAPLCAHATLRERLFAHPPPMALPPTPAGEADQLAEPASHAGAGWPRDMRPNRSGQDLESFRQAIALGGLAAPVPARLVDDLHRFEIRQSEFARPAGDPAQVQDFPGVPADRARHNDFAAVSAYGQVRGLFDRIAGFGFAYDNLLAHLRFPLVVRYRAAMSRGPGRDGRVVNAEVDFVAPIGNPRPLEVRLGLADLQRSASEREPLGIAADARWCWHEFGHVLLAGATDRLEFAFAHSPGDALAAIVNDPRSRFSGDTRPHGLRFATYPWVHISRRHDRAVEQGWSWAGTYHRSSHFRLGVGADFHKGYDAEQILSTTLFRLYRALGGDTVTANPLAPVDLPARDAAANYTVYLIMRAVRLMAGSASVHIPQVRFFADALMMADVATRRSQGGLLANRVGGCAHKVVRWAFEQQGLYAGVAAGAIHDAPGRPPAVDVFIDDRRQLSDPNHVAGSYTPVSLHWNAAGAAPDWHAHAQAIEVDQTNPASPLVTVRVGNRGYLPAVGTVVAVWYIPWDGSFPVPPWNRCAPVTPAADRWTPLAAPAGGPVVIAPGAVRVFGPFTGLPVLAGRYLVLAEVNAIGDRANTFNLLPCASPLYGVFDLPCASGNTRLVDLVAGDNNLALMVHTVP